MLQPYEDGTTVQSILDDADFIAFNRRLWSERIEPMSRVLLEGIGVGVERLRRLPVLFLPTGEARTPNVVNCLVLPGMDGAAGVVAMSEPCGPLIDGVDLFKADIERRLEGLNARLAFLDDQSYHRWSGNVHCATNAIRPMRRV